MLSNMFAAQMSVKHVQGKPYGSKVPPNPPVCLFQTTTLSGNCVWICKKEGDKFVADLVVPCSNGNPCFRAVSPCNLGPGEVPGLPKLGSCKEN